MAAAAPALLIKLAKQGYGAIRPTAGIAALQQALRGWQGMGGHPIVSSFHWDTFLKGKHTFACMLCDALCCTKICSQWKIEDSYGDTVTLLLLM